VRHKQRMKVGDVGRRSVFKRPQAVVQAPPWQRRWAPPK
jgi:hypothetical protein